MAGGSLKAAETRGLFDASHARQRVSRMSRMVSCTATIGAGRALREPIRQPDSFHQVNIVNERSPLRAGSKFFLLLRSPCDFRTIFVKRAF
jgi:hypothetical protein